VEPTTEVIYAIHTVWDFQKQAWNDAEFYFGGLVAASATEHGSVDHPQCSHCDCAITLAHVLLECSSIIIIIII